MVLAYLLSYIAIHVPNCINCKLPLWKYTYSEDSPPSSRHFQSKVRSDHQTLFLVIQHIPNPKPIKETLLLGNCSVLVHGLNCTPVAQLYRHEFRGERCSFSLICHAHSLAMSPFAPSLLTVPSFGMFPEDVIYPKLNQPWRFLWGKMHSAFLKENMSELGH